MRPDRFTRSGRTKRSRNTALILAGLLFLFILRVVGQLFVFLGLAPFLPPMDAWYSGLLPYGPLLVSQVAIIAVYAKACGDVWRGDGLFARRHPGLGRGLLIFGAVYFAAMIVRWAMGVGPMIPIVFHFVLSSFLIVLGAHLRRPSGDA
jgi:hypothetical protein